LTIALRTGPIPMARWPRSLLIGLRPRKTIDRVASSAANRCPTIPFRRRSSAFRNRERPIRKTGFCSCLRPGEGDSDIGGLYGHLVRLRDNFGNSEVCD
jgi:hypothetical protein